MNTQENMTHDKGKKQSRNWLHKDQGDGEISRQGH